MLKLHDPAVVIRTKEGESFFTKDTTLPHDAPCGLLFVGLIGILARSIGAQILRAEQYCNSGGWCNALLLVLLHPIYRWPPPYGPTNLWTHRRQHDGPKKEQLSLMAV